MTLLSIFIILFIGPILILKRRKKSSAKMEAIVALGCSFILSSFLLSTSISNQGFSAYIFNQEIDISILEGLMGVFFTGIGFLIVWASKSMIDYDLKAERLPIFYAMVLSLIGCLCGMVFFDNLILVFIFIELSAFIAAGIVMIKDGEENSQAGLKYLFLSIFASAFLLTGIVMLYRLTGTFTLDHMSYKLIAISDLTLIRYSFIFIFIGVALKSALFPFHIWLPDAHGSAPAVSSAILSSLVLKGYIVFFIKLIYIAYGIETVKLLNLLPIIMILGICAMLYGSVMAIMQRKLKKIIAYSSVAQIGYIFMGIGLGSSIGLIASIFHIIAHGVTKACLFLCAGEIIMQSGHKEIKAMKGIGKSLPITMGLFTICGLSMIGIPLLIGFSSKWLFALAIVRSEMTWIIIALSISGLLNALYYLPISIRAYFNIDSKQNKSTVENLEQAISKQLPIILLGCLVIVFGIYSKPIIDLISLIVEKL